MTAILSKTLKYDIYYNETFVDLVKGASFAHLLISEPPPLTHLSHLVVNVGWRQMPVEKGVTGGSSRSRWETSISQRIRNGNKPSTEGKGFYSTLVPSHGQNQTGICG